MDNLELIWKYIDGTCSQEERDLFSSKMSDVRFADEYQSALEMHGTLVRETPRKAPINLIEQTLLRLAREPKFKLSHISSISTKPFWLFIGGISLMSICMLLMGPQMSSSTPMGIGAGLIKYIPATDLKLPVLSMDLSLFSYLIALAILPAVYLMDRMFIRYKTT